MNSYSSIFNLGHKAVKDLLNSPVIVEEKVDGSQFSFCKLDDEYKEIKFRSKNASIDPYSAGMFQAGVDAILEIEKGDNKFVPGWTYRGEYLSKPKHNALFYERVPRNHVIIFDIDQGDQDYLAPGEKRMEAQRLGLECVPEIFYGSINSIEQFKTMLETKSVLGNVLIEGVVIKPWHYDLYGQDKKVLMGKYVSEAFKEVHAKEWGAANPKKKDIIEELIGAYTTEARWQKAVQHFRDMRLLHDEPKDIGMLIKEIPSDVLKECEEEIKDRLFKFVWPQIKRGLTRGFPEWYKERLLEVQFEGK